MGKLQTSGIMISIVSGVVAIIAVIVSATWWISHSIHESQTSTNKAIAELRVETTKAIAEVRGEVAVLSTRMDGLETRIYSLEGKVEGISEYLRNRDNQDAPKDTSTLDLEKSPL